MTIFVEQRSGTLSTRVTGTELLWHGDCFVSARSRDTIVSYAVGGAARKFVEVVVVLLVNEVVSNG